MLLAAEVKDRRTQLTTKQTAKRQYKPSSPDLQKILGFAFGGGLAFGAALVFLFHKLDRTISISEEAHDYFNLPIHGVISEIVTRKIRAQRFLRRWIVTPAIAVILLAAIGVSLFSFKLWLLEPDEYKLWSSSPTSYVIQLVKSHIGL